MTVHATILVCSPTQQSDPPTEPTPAPPEYPDVIDSRVSQNVKNNYTAVLPGQEIPAATPDTTDGTVHVRGLYRFEFAEDKAALLDALVDNVVIDAEWYELRYHECDHDADAPTGCPGWVAERSNGTVPSDV